MIILETIEKMDTLLTVERLGRLTGTSPKALYKAIKAGTLPAYHIGGSIRLEPSEVAAWLRDRHTKE